MKLVAALVFIAATAATASAQTESSESLKAQDCKKAREAGKACVLSFEGTDIEGGVESPDGIVINPRDLSTFGSLIRIRFDFIAEIIRATENL